MSAVSIFTVPVGRVARSAEGIDVGGQVRVTVEPVGGWALTLASFLG